MSESRSESIKKLNELTDKIEQAEYWEMTGKDHSIGWVREISRYGTASRLG